MSLTSRLRLLAWCFAVLGTSTALAADPAGVVLLHSNQGRPGSPYLSPLVSALQQQGFLVNTPEMPWSGDRNYDRSFEAAMEEIDDAVKALRDQGAKKIFIAGYSLGAAAALHYATRVRVDGVLALAPGHTPEQPGFQRSRGNSVARAKSMVRAGKGDERASFSDEDQGDVFTVETTANIYLSYTDPEGQAVIPKSAAALKAGTPLLWVVGTNDPMYKRGPSYAFEKASPDPRSKYLVVQSNHRDTPRDATNEIISWLNSLR